jgi:D-galactose 1-dehydrogenase
VDPIKIGIVGVGAIAKRQHIPALNASRDFALVACADANADGSDTHRSLADMLDSGPHLDAIAICTPPKFHYDDAALALRHGKHVLLEKPPCDTTEQLHALEAVADEAKRTLFTAWHSQFAAGVNAAKDWLKGKRVNSAHVVWKEDLEKYHHGQEWIKKQGGYGVFDPGINALSVLTRILPTPIRLIDSDLHIPPGWETPDRAKLLFHCDDGADITADFAFHQAGGEDIWNIEARTEEGVLTLSQGGAVLVIDGVRASSTAEQEYPALYRHFASLIQNQTSDVDAQPLRLAEQAFRSAATDD